ncbi:MAG: hypothetical protein Q4B75_03790 [Eubacteriales bacterium]|nr:hypothetical protein [Eubacteriales bacterium]
MRIDKKIFAFFLGFILVGTLVAVFFPKEEKRNDDAVIRIGAGDDMSGILMDETVAQLDGKYTISDSVESSSFQDC